MRIPPQPFTFALRPDLAIHSIYSGWFFVGRPTLEELRQDLRTIMQTPSNYSYEAYATPEARRIRIPQQEWLDRDPISETVGFRSPTVWFAGSTIGREMA